MRITLHFGAHRSASTTLQRVLGGSQDSLRARDLCYWGPKRTRGGLFEGLTSNTEPDLPWRRKRPDRSNGRVALALEQAEAQGAADLMVSEENMLGTMRPMLNSATFYPDAAARIDRIAQAFDGQVDQVCLALRSYDHWWASALGFQLMRGGPVPTADLRARLLHQSRRWRDVMRELSVAFPKARIVIWTYEALAAQPETILRALIGRDLGRLEGIRDWHNTGPTAAHLRQVLHDVGAPDGLISEQSGRFMPFLPSERAKLHNDYLADLAWLRDVAGQQFDYIDDLGHNPDMIAMKGSGHGGENRRMAGTGEG